MAENIKTNDEAMEDLVQYLERKYSEPKDWALDLSLFLKALAMKHWNPQALEEVWDKLDNGFTFRSLMKLLSGLATHRDLNMAMADFAGTLRSIFPSYAAYAQDVKATVFNFETDSAYTLRISEDPPTSAVNSLTLNGNGPVTVTISVQKKADTTASVNDNGDAKSEGSESA